MTDFGNFSITHLHLALRDDRERAAADDQLRQEYMRLTASHATTNPAKKASPCPFSRRASVRGSSAAAGG